MSEQTHDRLQAECFQWLWNTYPETRYCCFAVINEMKHAGNNRAFNVAKLKAVGMLPGVWDMLFYWKGVLYAFDIKVGKDKLSEKQVKFKEAIEKQGGICYEIRTFEQFKALFSVFRF